MIAREALFTGIKSILVEVLGLEIGPEQIDDDDALFAHGMGVDSIEALEILEAIERRFGVKIRDDDIGLSLFQDVRSLAEVVEAELGRRAGRAKE